MKQDMQWQIGPQTLTKLEYFALVIGASLARKMDIDDMWADESITAAQLLIEELNKDQSPKVKP